VHHVLTQSASVRRPKVVFDGLSDTVVGLEETAILPCRIRQLTKREQYMDQGNNVIGTHRVYFFGTPQCLEFVKPENVLFIEEKRYRIMTVNETKTRTYHHLEVDVKEVEGIE
jgi:hypothetical protein